MFGFLGPFLRLDSFLKLIKNCSANILPSRTEFMEGFGFATQLTSAKLVTVKVGIFIFIFIQVFVKLV